MRRIVVGCTTIPSRLKYLSISLNSIKRQTISPDRIYLFLPKFSAKEKCVYPPIVFSEKKYLTSVNKKTGTVYINADKSLIQIVETPEDYGPITKLYPVTRMTREEMGFDEQDEILYITIDDDREYSPFTIESLVNAYDELKVPLAVGLVGWIYGSGFKRWLKIYSPEKITKVDWIEGSYGVIYNYDLLSVIGDRFIDFSQVPEAKYCDDMWICHWLKKIYLGNPNIWACKLDGYNPMNDNITEIQSSTPAKYINALHRGQTTSNDKQEGSILDFVSTGKRYLDIANKIQKINCNFLTSPVPPSENLGKSEFFFWNILVWVLVGLIVIIGIILLMYFAFLRPSMRYSVSGENV